MPFPETRVEQAYNTAICLNNVAVSLLERRCIRPAMAAFKDSVSLMKCISSLSTSGYSLGQKRPSSLPEFADLDGKVKRASHDLRHALPDDDITALPPIQTFNEAEYTQVIASCLSQDENFFLQSDSIFLIRMEMTESSMNPHDTPNVDLESSIILNNFANAYLIQAFSLGTTVDSTIMQHLEAAYQLFHLSYALLHGQSFNQDFLPLSILVLGSLFRFATTLSREMKARDFYYQAMELQYIFMELNCLLSDDNVTVAAPAAWNCPRRFNMLY